MQDGYFDAAVAESYDTTEAGMFGADVLDPAVDFLAAIAGHGRALEFGVGTGRVALPLAARGVAVQGIDVSRPMLDRLRRKPGGDRLPVVEGDFSTTRVDGEFRLVYLVFNTIMNLTTQEAQTDCFRNAAAHLEPGGGFVVEVAVPQLRRLAPGDRYLAFDVGDTHLGFDEYRVAEQSLVSHHYRVVAGRAVIRSAPFRYVWPSELDLMARMAGMEPSQRWGGWNREPFTDDSTSHVSVWRKGA